jgi:hypothetical protein
MISMVRRYGGGSGESSAVTGCRQLQKSEW